MSSLRSIESSDVIRLIAQFLSEHNLPHTRDALLAETSVPLLDASVSLDSLAADCRAGRWDAVLQAVAAASLDADTLTDLYAHVALELVDAKDVEAATALLQHAPPLARLRKADRARFAQLEAQLSAFDPVAAYGGAGDAAAKDKRRKAIAKALCRQLRVAPPGRLLALLAQALQWQQFRGLLPPAGQPYDLFADVALPDNAAATNATTTNATATAAERAANAASNAVASDLVTAIMFGKSSTPMCA